MPNPCPWRKKGTTRCKCSRIVVYYPAEKKGMNMRVGYGYMAAMVAAAGAALTPNGGSVIACVSRGGYRAHNGTIYVASKGVMIICR